MARRNPQLTHQPDQGRGRLRAGCVRRVRPTPAASSARGSTVRDVRGRMRSFRHPIVRSRRCHDRTAVNRRAGPAWFTHLPQTACAAANRICRRPGNQTAECGSASQREPPRRPCFVVILRACEARYGPHRRWCLPAFVGRVRWNLVGRRFAPPGGRISRCRVACIPACPGGGRLHYCPCSCRVDVLHRQRRTLR